MTPGPRDPDACRHRVAGPRRPGSRPSCALASAEAGVACEVDRDACEACCRHPIPAGARSNPVVASLVFEGAGRARALLAPGDPARAEVDRSRRFAVRWLRDETGAPPAEGPGPARVARPPGPRGGGGPARIGLVGCATRTGRGYENRDIAAHLGVARWLVPGGDDATARGVSCRVDVAEGDPGPDRLRAWLDGLDVVLFTGAPDLPGLAGLARGLGVRVACVPHWEWLHPGLEWLDDVDLMLAPTRHTAGLLSGWKARYGFAWGVACVPWPVDVDRFRFRERARCRRFVFVTGTGGTRAVRAGGGEVRRKGLGVVIEAARLAPEVPLVVYASPGAVPSPPANVEVRPHPEDNRMLYLDGDACVQPSLWEGLGLPLLECQAAGMPLITTDAPPMDEHDPMARVRAAREAVELPGRHTIVAAMVDPGDLAATLRSVLGRRIAARSRRARRFIERHHSWHRAGPAIRDALSGLSSGDAASPRRRSWFGRN